MRDSHHPERVSELVRALPANYVPGVFILDRDAAAAERPRRSSRSGRVEVECTPTRCTPVQFARYRRLGYRADSWRPCVRTGGGRVLQYWVAWRVSWIDERLLERIDAAAAADQ